MGVVKKKKLINKETNFVLYTLYDIHTHKNKNTKNRHGAY